MPECPNCEYSAEVKFKAGDLYCEGCGYDESSDD